MHVRNAFLAALIVLPHSGRALAADANVQSYAPATILPKQAVTILGSGFGGNAQGRSLRWGQGQTPLGTIPGADVTSWSPTAIALGKTPQLANGTYWIAIYDGATPVSNFKSSLVVKAPTPTPKPLTVQAVDGTQPVLTYVGPPKVEAIMLFSSCSPGGTMALKGEGFGSAVGKILVVGKKWNGTPVTIEVPGNPDWKTTLAGGKVPAAVSEMLDQQVQIKVMTADGKVSSNSVPCGFNATRKTELLPTTNQGYTLGRCDVGDNYKEGDKHQNISGAYTVICYHKVDHNFGYSGTTGTDPWNTVTLKNGWHFTKWNFGENNDSGGRILSRGGFVQDGTQSNIFVKWQTDRVGVVHYSFTLSIEGPSGVPFH